MDPEAFWFMCLVGPVIIYGLVRIRYVILNPAADNPRLAIIALIWVLFAAAVVCMVFPEARQ